MRLRFATPRQRTTDNGQRSGWQPEIWIYGTTDSRNYGATELWNKGIESIESIESIEGIEGIESFSTFCTFLYLSVPFCLSSLVCEAIAKHNSAKHPVVYSNWIISATCMK